MEAIDLLAKNVYRILNENTNEKITDFLIKNNEHCYEIKERYKKIYNKDIIVDVKKKKTGNTKRLIIGFFYNPIEYDCHCIRKATRMFKNNYDILIEIFTTRTPVELNEIKKMYIKMYPEKCLAKDIDVNDTYFNNILFRLLCGERSSDKMLNENECENLGKKLFDLEKEKKIDLNCLIFYFVKKSKENFEKIVQFYFKYSNKTILQFIETEYTGNLKKCLTAIVYGLLCPYEYFYIKIIKALKENDIKTLIRIIITRRFENKLYKKRYEKEFNKKLDDEIKIKLDKESYELINILLK